MKTIAISSIITVTLAFSQITTAAENINYQCTNGGATRTISVEYAAAGTLPCKVTYQKEGEATTLWSAQSEQGYCEEKAKGFVEKQRNWGWACDAAANTVAVEAAQ